MYLYTYNSSTTRALPQTPPRRSRQKIFLGKGYASSIKKGLECLLLWLYVGSGRLKM